ncbi:hypothetical protein D3C81_847380 [compost metagenome]
MPTPATPVSYTPAIPVDVIGGLFRDAWKLPMSRHYLRDTAGNKKPVKTVVITGFPGFGDGSLQSV